MPTFKVLGGRTVVYHTTVEASDKYEAFEIANNLTSDQWDELETDNVIEATDVFGEDEE